MGYEADDLVASEISGKDEVSLNYVFVALLEAASYAFSFTLFIFDNPDQLLIILNYFSSILRFIKVISI